MIQTIHNVHLIFIISILIYVKFSPLHFIWSPYHQCAQTEDSPLAIFYGRSNDCSCHTHHLLCSYYIMAVRRYCKKPSIYPQASGSVLLLVTPLESSGSWTQTSAFLLTKEDFLFFDFSIYSSQTGLGSGPGEPFLSQLTRIMLNR